MYDSIFITKFQEKKQRKNTHQMCVSNLAIAIFYNLDKIG